MNQISNEPYDNQTDVDKVKAMIAGISPDLKPTSYYLGDGGRIVTCVVVNLPVKGNKDVIAKLVSSGFEKGERRKARSDREWPSFGGYSFDISLRYSMTNPVNMRRLRKEVQHAE